MTPSVEWLAFARRRGWPVDGVPPKTEDVRRVSRLQQARILEDRIDRAEANARAADDRRTRDRYARRAEALAYQLAALDAAEADFTERTFDWPHRCDVCDEPIPSSDFGRGRCARHTATHASQED